MAHSRHLALEDLRLARDPDHLLALFRKLAYRTEPELVPLDPTGLEFPERAGIQRCLLLADHPGPPGLQVLLFELDAVRMAELPGTNWFFVDEAGDPTQCRKITPLWPGPVTGRMACRAGFRTQRSDYRLIISYQNMPWMPIPCFGMGGRQVLAY